MNVTDERFRIYDLLISTLHQKMLKKKPLILAIDGMCGSGKTTLAEYLCSKFSTAVIHMDNFFLPFERKTSERLAEAGGNIDYERFCEIMLPALAKGTPFSYTAYNCQTASFDRQILIPECDLLIIEGSYSLHKKFGEYYDFSLFLKVDSQEQLLRLKNRCQDAHKLKRFQNEWIPMEQHYHTAQQVIPRCHLVIDTTSN